MEEARFTPALRFKALTAWFDTVMELTTREPEIRRKVVERALFFPVQILDGFETTSDNVRGRLPGFALEARLR